VENSELKIVIVGRSSRPGSKINTAYLKIDHWNDFSYVTMFYLYVNDSTGKSHEIGNIKIAFKGQTTEISTYQQLGESFSSLSDDFFSLGTDLDYYENLGKLPDGIKEQLVTALNDIVHNNKYLEIARKEQVFKTSLLRSVSMTSIEGQFSRALKGLPPLSDFKFSYVRPDDEEYAGVRLDFLVHKNSKPSSNIHAIIGRNGVGKTTLLNGMIQAVVEKENTSGEFINIEEEEEKPISPNYFSSLVSVSFSAFDPFQPPKEQSDPTLGSCYYYIGLKDEKRTDRLRALPELQWDCSKALIDCFQTKGKKTRWQNAIETLSSDDNFADMGLPVLIRRYRILKKENPEMDTKDFITIYMKDISKYLERMSSGHFIVLYTVTKLVATVEEKTLVLLDEPESHLHPPLLSAFVRTLSDLLYDRNGVAIIATHSPVVLQEIPMSCVWKIYRRRLSLDAQKPEIETFGENVGTLTKEVFGLEVIKSGFHQLLKKSVIEGSSYRRILSDYDSQIGYEARAILKAMVNEYERKGED